MPDRTCLSGQIVYRQKRKKPVGEDGLLTDLVPGRLWRAFLPATLRVVASQRSNPLPADLSCSKNHSPTNNR
ncbi:hypothetical protein CPZ26_005685 [Raoultella ornithinolytica]|nr:hypothetical protein CU101_05815 [Raoultella ornithinolytica]PJO28835.1 hypothetical protein CPZ26_005685 [Raoultella ornithinolytica]